MKDHIRRPFLQALRHSAQEEGTFTEVTLKCSMKEFLEYLQKWSLPFQVSRMEAVEQRYVQPVLVVQGRFVRVVSMYDREVRGKSFDVVVSFAKS